MAKRVQQHQVEDESIVQFRALLPRSWVYREEEKDYGIDASIEVFSEDDFHTGLRAFVQLKGTDSTKHREQRTIRFTTDNLSYWRAQDLPVLLIRYSSQERKIYWSWDFDRRIQISDNAENASIALSEEDLWTDLTPSLIENQLFKLSILRGSTVSFPIGIFFEDEITEDNIVCHQTLREKLLPFNSMIKYGGRSCEVGLTLTIHKKELIISLAGIATAAIPYDESVVSQLADNVVAGCAYCFAAVNQTHLSKQLLESCYKTADYHCFDDVANLLSIEILKSSNLALLVEISKNAQIRGLNSLGVDMWTFAPIFHSDRFNVDQKEIALDAMLYYLEYCVNNDDDRGGRIAYNCSEFAIRCKQFRIAIKLLRLASKLDPSYLTRPYFFITMGGAFFQGKRYKASSISYLKALKLEDVRKSTTKALLSDSLLQQGKIGSALFWIDKALEAEDIIEDGRYSSFCFLHLAIINLKLFAPNRIQRKTIGVSNLMKEAFKSDGHDRISLLDSGVLLDPLCPSLWHAIGVERSMLGDGELAIKAFAFAAAFSEYHAGYWLDLILICMYEKVDQDFLTLCISAASSHGMEHISEEIQYRLDSGDGEITRACPNVPN